MPPLRVLKSPYRFRHGSRPRQNDGGAVSELYERKANKGNIAFEQVSLNSEGCHNTFGRMWANVRAIVFRVQILFHFY